MINGNSQSGMYTAEDFHIRKIYIYKYIFYVSEDKCILSRTLISVVSTSTDSVCIRWISISK